MSSVAVSCSPSISASIGRHQPASHCAQLPCVSGDPHSQTTSSCTMPASSPARSGPPALPEKPKLKPTVAPKPKMDLQTHSARTLEQSVDVDLDALIGELCELEATLQNSSPESLFPGLSGSANRGVSVHGPSNGACNVLTVSSSLRKMDTSLSTTSARSEKDCFVAPSCLLQQQNVDNFCSGPGAGSKNKNLVVESYERQNSWVRSQSPDNDSAFCDTSSMLSMESVPLSVSHSNDSNNGSCEEVDHARGAMATPSPTHLTENIRSQLVQETVPNEDMSEEERMAILKAEKIKLAIEKMKEASIKKLFTKVYTADGNSKSIMVNEKMSVTDVVEMLAEKCQTLPTINHCIVEQCLDLHMERLYEDHENIVENVLMWTRDSPNKLLFTERPEKYDLFKNPELYLLSPSAVGSNLALEAGQKRQIIEEFFSPSNVQPPDLEGMLYLKTDGKKAWKKHMFVLRASGLYYNPKGKAKSSQDLQCLMRLEMVQCYAAVGWKKKYKAPTDFGFALKHPRIQVKASKYIKYLCADDEVTLNRWLMGMRIAINGQQLVKNCEAAKELLSNDCLKEKASSASALSSTSHSSNTEYRESVVVRPPTARQGTENGSAKNIVLCTASVNGDRGAPGAGSKIERTPSLSSADSGRSNGTARHCDLSSSSNKTAETKYCPGELADASAAALETVSLVNGFESDCLGTIRKRPSPAVTGDSSFATASASTGRLNTVHFGQLTDTTRHIHSVIQDMKYDEECSSRSNASLLSSLDGSSQFTAGSDDAEVDSDEEFPPPPPEVDVCFFGASNDFSDSSLLGDNRQESVLSSPSLQRVQPQVEDAVIAVRMRNDSYCDAFDSSPAATATRKSKPPPPKRSENTRLSTFSASSAEGARSPESTVPAVNAFAQAITNGCTSPSRDAAPPQVKPKPVVPVKPKKLIGNSKENADSAITAAAPVPQQLQNSNTTLMSDLQKAMQKRLQKIEADTAASHGSAPN